MTQVLIDRPEIQLTKPNTHGQTALHLAAQNGHLELSRMLVQAGSDLDYADLIGENLDLISNHKSFFGLRLTLYTIRQAYFFTIFRETKADSNSSNLFC